MEQEVLTSDNGNVLSLEEIGNLAADGGKPADTLMNVVALIAKRFQNRRLLGLSAGARSRQSRAGRDPRTCAANASATCACRSRRSRRPGRRAGAPGRRRPRQEPIRASSTFKEAGEEAYQSFLGVPLIDRGVLQGVLVVQTIEARVFQRRRNPHADRGRHPGRARRQRSPHPRSLHRARRRSASGRWPAISGGAGITTASASSAISIPPAGASSITIRSPCSARFLSTKLEAPRRRTRAAQPHQLRLPPPAGVSRRRPHLGRATRRRPAPASRRLLLRRVRPARIAPDLLRRPRRSRRRSHQERLRSRHSAGRHRPLLRPGLLPPAPRSTTAGSRKNISQTDVNQLPMAARHRHERRAGRHRDRDSQRLAFAPRSGASKSAAAICCCSTPTSKATLPKIANSPRASTAAIAASASARNCCSASAASARSSAMGISPGVLHLNEGHSGFAVLEAIRTRMEEEGIDFDTAASQVSARSRLHHAHAGARRPRPLQRRPHRGASRTAARAARSISTRASWASAAKIPTIHDETFCMTVLGLKLSRRANAVSSLHGEVSRAMWTGLYPGKLGRRRAHRPHHQRRPRALVARAADVPPLRSPSRRRTGKRSSGAKRTWEGIENVDDGELWETHLSLKSQPHRLRPPPRRRAGRTPRRIAATISQRLRNASLSPDALTIGFARRFATYKRANLLLDRHRAPGLHGQRSQASRAVRLRRQGPSARRTRQARPAADRRADARPAVRATNSSSSRTTTSTSAATSCRASTSGSTIRAGRSKPPAPAARKSC